MNTRGSSYCTYKDTPHQQQQHEPNPHTEKISYLIRRRTTGYLSFPIRMHDLGLHFHHHLVNFHIVYIPLFLLPLTIQYKVEVKELSDNRCIRNEYLVHKNYDILNSPWTFITYRRRNIVLDILHEFYVLLTLYFKILSKFPNYNTFNFTFFTITP